MFWTSILLMIAGIALFAFGWILNTQTPVQQPLPLVGLGLIAIGIVVLLIKLGMVLA